MTRSMHILLVDDEEIIHQTVGEYLRDCGHRVDSACNVAAALQHSEENDYDIALVDVRLPKTDGFSFLAQAEQVRPLMPVVFISGHGTVDMVIEGIRRGAADFLTKPVKLLELDAVLEKCLQVRAVRKEVLHLRATITAMQQSWSIRERGHRLVGASSGMQGVREQILHAVASGCDTILITGETGTGKEVVARQIHMQAASGEMPFIAVSCPTLPESLIESELFGHVKGSFTGAAQDRAGYFELAKGGTLFLDEIADLSPSLQARLLRVLETRTFRRLGGSEEIKVGLRVIAATNSELEAAMAIGRFRRDLFYRLSVFPIHIPPLRERAQDILPLADFFLSAYAKERNLSFHGLSKEAQDHLLEYDYPGNVRELRNIVERAAILCGSGSIQTEHLILRKASPAPINRDPASGNGEERETIRQALKESRWNRRRAADLLEMPYSTLRYKMKILKIE